MDKTRIHIILNEIRDECFIDTYKPTDEELMGLLLSHYFDFDGLSILKAAYSGLEEANFHTENEVIHKLIHKLEEND